MTILTTTVSGISPLAKAVIRIKPISEMRPVTATLDYPAILDVTFIKKLDMTSFTKKGLIAISKICGISLVKRSEDKKILKRLKRNTAERVKKESRKKSLRIEPSEEHANTNPPKTKYTTPKTVPKIKVPNVSVSRMESKSVGPRIRAKDSKPSVDDILYGPVEISVTEPCKTCGRSEHPERFHSHPKQTSAMKQQQQQQKHNPCVSGRAGQILTERKLAPPSPKSTTRRHSTGHLQSERCSKLRVADVEVSFHSDNEIETKKMPPKSKALQQSFSPIESSIRQKSKEKKDLQSEAAEENSPAKRGTETSSCSYSSRENMKYVTRCYVCGKQMTREARFSHEEECIAVWRKQNSQLPPDERRAEPVRPDFRFTESGDVDFEGTFQSIWANHTDSLVPCAKCKRTFFPERIEKHEACCNQKPSKQKHPTPRNKLNI